MKTIINTPKAPAPIGPYNQAVLIKDTLYISGQIPIDPATGSLVEGNIKEENSAVDGKPQGHFGRSWNDF